MQIITDIAALRAWRNASSPVAFVPTMGNLHSGHIALCHEARRQVGPQGRVIVSIFVNPLQFGPGEDLDKYPRTFATDCEKLQAAGVDAVFHPSVETLYPHGPQQYLVEPPALQNQYCGAFRPGHFRGVATVVCKLFNLVQPDVAVFGKKDYQQLKVIEGMVQDLNMPVRVVGLDTQRAGSGLALSSRNGYLTEAELAEAPRLQRTLQEIKAAVLAGARDFTQLEQQAAAALDAHGWRTDYIRILDQRTLQTPPADERALVILAASSLGKARLIDNLEINL